MRKIVVLSFISLDGVMQAPGGPQEDTSGDFTLGGWTVPFFDDEAGKVMDKQLGQPYDLLLGRKTYDIFASYWPQNSEGPGVSINKATKYVVSSGKIDTTAWRTTFQLKGIEDIRKLKQERGPMLQVHGSSELAHALLANDLVDELWLKTFPVVLGKGKKLFGNGPVPAAYQLTDSVVTPKGVVVANYVRDGAVKTGSFD